MPFFLMKNMWQIEDDIKPAYAAGRLFGGDDLFKQRVIFTGLRRPPLQSPLASRILLVSFLVLFEEPDRLQWRVPLCALLAAKKHPCDRSHATKAPLGALGYGFYLQFSQSKELFIFLVKP